MTLIAPSPSDRNYGRLRDTLSTYSQPVVLTNSHSAGTGSGVGSLGSTAYLGKTYVRNLFRSALEIQTYSSEASQYGLPCRSSSSSG